MLCSFIFSYLACCFVAPVLTVHRAYCSCNAATWRDAKFRVTLKSILEYFSLHISQEMDTNDALRFKSGRVVYENCSQAAFEVLCKRLTEDAISDGQGGDLLWRRRHITALKNGFKARTSLAINTVSAAATICNLGCLTSDLSDPAASFGCGIVKISNMNYGDVKFFDLPASLDFVETTRNGITVTSMELGFGIGIVANCSSPYPRVCSGAKKYESGEGRLPGCMDLPLLPPYSSYKNYMQFHLGLRILVANGFLRRKTEELPGGSRLFPNSILQAAKGWAHADNKPDRVDRLHWHHPRLTKAKCGELPPDHVRAAALIQQQEVARRLQHAHARRERKKAFADQKRNLATRIRDARRTCGRKMVQELVEEWSRLTNGAKIFFTYLTLFLTLFYPGLDSILPLFLLCPGSLAYVAHSLCEGIVCMSLHPLPLRRLGSLTCCLG